MQNFYEEFKNKTNYEINNAFLKECMNGNLEKIKYLLNSPELEFNASTDVYDSETDNTGYLFACRYGHLDIVKYLLTSPELKYHCSIHSENRTSDTGVQIACNYGHLDILKYLLTSPDLKEHCNISDNEYWALSLACEHGHLNIVKYLISSSELKDEKNLIEITNDALSLACEHGHLDIVKYFLSLSFLKEQVDYTRLLSSSRWSENLEIAEYLIFELNIIKDKETLEYLENNQPNFAKQLESMFIARDLNKELNSDNNINKKIKI